MSTLNGQELEIFRAGPHGIKGRRVFTPAEVEQIAQDYGTDGHEAPIVIGHPKLDSPAFGWIKGVRAQNGILYATPHQVVPEFDQAVMANHYKKRSAAFDPLPNGKWQLRHVGYLGGTPPVVKGLADARFATEQYEEGTEFSTEGEGMAEQVEKKTIVDAVREVFADMFGGGKEKGVQTVDVAALEQRLEAKFAADIKKETDARIAAETKFADFQAKHQTSATAETAIAKLKADGKWLPAFDKMHIPALFAALADGDTQEITFADDKGVQQKLPTLDALSTLLGNITKFVPKGQTFGDEQAAAAVVVPANTPAGADPGSVQMDAEAKALAKAENIPYANAVKRLAAQGKSSESYASATSGAV